jgi:hypothetical protein
MRTKRDILKRSEEAGEQECQCASHLKRLSRAVHPQQFPRLQRLPRLAPYITNGPYIASLILLRTHIFLYNLLFPLICDHPPASASPLTRSLPLAPNPPVPPYPGSARPGWCFSSDEIGCGCVLSTPAVWMLVHSTGSRVNFHLSSWEYPAWFDKYLGYLGLTRIS